MNAFSHIAIASKPASCETHGAFESRNGFGTIWSRCPSCETERREAEAARKEEQEREDRRYRWARKVEGAGIPERFRNRTFENFVADSDGKQKALAFASDYAERFTESAYESGKSAVFVGKPGTGKTHLAVAIGMAAMKAGHSVMFCTVLRAIRRVKDTWGRDSQERESQAVAALVFPDLLILDEVGVQFGSETEKNILFDILNDRYEQRKPCMLLSNLALQDVQSFLGERVFDRLREDGGEAIAFDWESHRGKA